MEPLTFRLTKDLRKRLGVIADAESRSIAFLVRRAVEVYVKKKNAERGSKAVSAK